MHETMKIRIRSRDCRLFLPVPTSLLGLAIWLTPESAFAKMRDQVPAPYDGLIAKKAIRQLTRDCLDILQENKGLEIIHVEAADGTFVSIKL